VKQVASLLLLALSAAGCDGTPSTMTVTDAWTRPTPPGSDEAAFYLTFRNGTDIDDRVVAASSPSCMVVTPHLTEITDGVSRMAESGGDQLDMDPGAELVMEPNGLHLMCLGLSEPLIAGNPTEVTISFANAPAITVDVSVELRS